MKIWTLLVVNCDEIWSYAFSTAEKAFDFIDSKIIAPANQILTNSDSYFLFEDPSDEDSNGNPTKWIIEELEIDLGKNGEGF
jgi:hypothetical protein